LQTYKKHWITLLPSARRDFARQFMRRLATVLPAIEQGAGWAGGYTRIVCDAAETLWRCQRTDSIDIIERNLRQKVVEPDFR
jgi:hypothetical protein